MLEGVIELQKAAVAVRLQILASAWLFAVCIPTIPQPEEARWLSDPRPRSLDEDLRRDA